MKLPFEERDVEPLVKQEAEPSRYGSLPDERTVEERLGYSVVNLDKPSGPSSHQVSSYVKGILGARKAGHSGTLDPAVTGVLPVAVGRATRIAHALLKAGKEYVCLMHLHRDVPEGEVVKTLKGYVGRVKQLPPVRSAVKRRVRERRIYYLEVLEVQGRDVLFRVGCEAGTYIRRLCHQAGQDLGVGAHMEELRRTKSGPFKEEECCTLQDLAEAVYLWREEGRDSLLRKLLLPVERGVAHLPKVWVLDTAVDALSHGASLKVPGVSRLDPDVQPGRTIAVMTLKGELVMIGKALMDSSQALNASKGVFVKPEQVFMKPGIYPRLG